MKSLVFVLFVLVGSIILTNLPVQSYADSNLDTLLRIATQARDNIDIQLSQLATVPSEINQLHKQGSEETDALAQSISQNDQASSREHFLTAMKIFKEINDKISSLTPTITSEQSPQIDTLQLKSEINRAQMLGDKLKTIAIANNVEINFTKFNETIQDARQNLDVDNADQVNNDLTTVNQFLLDVHQLLADAAKKKTTDRAKDFTEKQIQRLSQVKETSPPQNITQSFTPLTTSEQQITNESKTGSIPDMIVQLKQFVSEGKIDEALKLIKLIEATQNQQTNPQLPVTEISNATQNSTIVNNPPHIDNERKLHEKRDNQTQSETANNVNATQNVNVNSITTKHGVNANSAVQNHVDNKKSQKETNSEHKDKKKIKINNSED